MSDLDRMIEEKIKIWYNLEKYFFLRSKPEVYPPGEENVFKKYKPHTHTSPEIEKVYADLDYRFKESKKVELGNFTERYKSKADLKGLEEELDEKISNSLYSVLTRKKIRSNRPLNEDEVKKRIKYAVNKLEPINLCVFWGGYKKSRRDGPDLLDTKALDILVNIVPKLNVIGQCWPCRSENSLYEKLVNDVKNALEKGDTKEVKLLLWKSMKTLKKEGLNRNIDSGSFFEYIEGWLKENLDIFKNNETNITSIDWCKENIIFKSEIYHVLIKMIFHDYIALDVNKESWRKVRAYREGLKREIKFHYNKSLIRSEDDILQLIEASELVKENGDYTTKSNAVKFDYGYYRTNLEQILRKNEEELKSEDEETKKMLKSYIKTMRKIMTEDSYKKISKWPIQRIRPYLLKIGEIRAKKLKREQPELFEKLLKTAKKYSKATSKVKSVIEYFSNRYVENVFYKTHIYYSNTIFVSFGSREGESLYSDLPIVYIKGPISEAPPWFSNDSKVMITDILQLQSLL